MTKYTKIYTGLALATALSAQAHADIRINGFANLTAGVTTEDTNIFETTEDFDFASKSLFALQLSGDVTENVTATAQIIGSGSDDFSAKFEWAYLTYNMSETSTITAGLFRLPLFRYSASIDVSYSYHWITAPETVYVVPFNNISGLRYDYANYSGDFEYLWQVSYGNYKEDTGESVTTGTDLFLTSFEGTYKSFKGRVAIGRADNTSQRESVNNILAGVAAASPTLADELALNDDSGVFVGVGFEYDNFEWFVSAEYTTIDVKESFNPKNTAYYVTAGTRLGKFTPHITYQAKDAFNDGKIKFQDTVASLPAALQPALGGANAGLQAATFADYSMITLGLRYDIISNTALKAEVTKFDNKLESMLSPDAPVDTNIVQFSVNYVF